MRVTYLPHARERMFGRKVSESEVEAVLRDYETDLPAKHGRKNRYKVVNGRRIRVTFLQTSADEYLVWTVTANEVVP